MSDIPEVIIDEVIARLKKDGTFSPNDDLRKIAIASVRDAMNVIESLGGEVIWHEVRRMG